MSKRHYENEFPSKEPQDSQIIDNGGRLLPKIRNEIEQVYVKLLHIFEANSTESIKGKDSSVYTGAAGYAYLYLKLFERSQNNDYLQKGSDWAEKSLKYMGRRQGDVTFLCGDLGPLCIAAAIRQLKGQADCAKECVSQVLAFLPGVLDLKSEIPNELLYGRVGYLYGLLFLLKYIPGCVDSQIIKQLAKAVIASGKRSENPSLMWHWHGKEYLGAAHGVAGILYLLLQMTEHLSPDDMALLKNTLDYVISIRYSSGNFPSSIGSSDDRLVHWCHGAPGYVQVLLSAAQVWQDRKYLEAAIDCGEIVWRRGLLKKGYGICHGVAGNAYTFIILYQATGHLIHLHRALQFALWCSTYDRNQDHPPDRPFSLFEGLAGTVYFLHDVLEPLHAFFPAYSFAAFRRLSF